MRLSEAWLREYVNPPINTQQLIHQLTMAGLEVDSVSPAAAVFSGVVVGEVLQVEVHPNADKLKVCNVSIGADEPLQIVCGAVNVSVGMRVPTAIIGAVLNDGKLKIKQSKLRGETSSGMLCAATELGLAESSEGLMVLPANAPLGDDLRQYLGLEDSILELDLTPNRADCLSVEGVARETALLNEIEFQRPAYRETEVTHAENIPITVSVPEACPRYLGRMITQVNAQAETPLWMQERLRRSGLRSLGPLVDVTNYVLLELGQPLHAFDASKLSEAIEVRWSRPDETLSLLNDQEITLDENILVIADNEKPVALAGIMGGKETAVDDATTRIFLECAFFTPAAMAGKARHFGLHTDSSHRFERGVDPDLQRRAMERASQLIVSIAGGEAGPIKSVCQDNEATTRNAITLRKERIPRILGVELETVETETILRRLGMQLTTIHSGWTVIPPSFRFDIAIEADLLEELGRVYGYDTIPKSNLLMRQCLGSAPETVLTLDKLEDLLVVRGYQQAITYSFVDERMQSSIAPDDPLIRLSNPLSSDLSVMRSTLWCGLLQAAQRNIHRQQPRVRLFESGQCFLQESDDSLKQDPLIAGLITGNVYDEQWGIASRQADFYDLKADVQAMLDLTGQGQHFSFTAAKHPALHPGQSARISNRDKQSLGWIGMLHPRLEKELGFNSQVFLFEMDLTSLLARRLPVFQSLSKFPSVRRDLAIVVDQNIPVEDLVKCIYSTKSSIVKNVKTFDVYTGERVELGKRSIAFGLIFQASSLTLTDSEIDAAVSEVLDKLAKEFRTELRD